MASEQKNKKEQEVQKVFYEEKNYAGVIGYFLTFCEYKSSIKTCTILCSIHGTTQHFNLKLSNQFVDVTRPDGFAHRKPLSPNEDFPPSIGTHFSFAHFYPKPNFRLNIKLKNMNFTFDSQSTFENMPSTSTSHDEKINAIDSSLSSPQAPELSFSEKIDLLRKASKERDALATAACTEPRSPGEKILHQKAATAKNIFFSPDKKFGIEQHISVLGKPAGFYFINFESGLEYEISRFNKHAVIDEDTDFFPWTRADGAITRFSRPDVSIETSILIHAIEDVGEFTTYHLRLTPIW